MESSLECPMCMEDHQESIRPPTTLECGHTICIVCAKSEVKNGKMTCPIDRHVLVINSLNPNYEMLNLIEEANKTIMEKKEIQQIVEKVGKVTKEKDEKTNENYELRRRIKNLEGNNRGFIKTNNKLKLDINKQIRYSKEMQEEADWAIMEKEEEINKNYELRQRIQNLGEENKRINSDLSILRCELNEQILERENMQQTISKVIKEKEEEINKNYELRERIQNLGEENQRINRELFILRCDVNKQILERENMQQTISKVIREKEEGIKKNYELRQRIQNLGEENLRINRDLSILRCDVKEQILEREDMQQTINKVIRENEEEINKNHEPRQRIPNFGEENQRINRDLSILRCDANEQILEREDMQQTISKVIREKENLENELNTLMAEYFEVRTLIGKERVDNKALVIQASKKYNELFGHIVVAGFIAFLIFVVVRHNQIIPILAFLYLNDQYCNSPVR